MSKQRYQQLHEQWFKERFPSAYLDKHYTPPVIPPTAKANGLTRYIVNVLFWHPQCNGTRVNSQGRLIDGIEVGPTGNKIGVKKFIPGTTRRGTADITATCKGRSVKFEVKAGKDRASQYQLDEQKREQQAGGHYFFVHDVEEFWEQFDYVMGL